MSERARERFTGTRVTLEEVERELGPRSTWGEAQRRVDARNREPLNPRHPRGMAITREDKPDPCARCGSALTWETIRHAPIVREAREGSEGRGCTDFEEVCPACYEKYRAGDPTSGPRCANCGAPLTDPASTSTYCARCLADGAKALETLGAQLAREREEALVPQLPRAPDLLRNAVGLRLTYRDGLGAVLPLTPGQHVRIFVAIDGSLLPGEEVPGPSPEVVAVRPVYSAAVGSVVAIARELSALVRAGGELGPEARHWVDMLVEAARRLDE